MIDKVYKLVQRLANKDQVGGYLPPSTFNQYAEFAQLDIITESYNTKQKAGYEDDFVNMNMYSKLRKQIPIVKSVGNFSKPSDYLYFSTAKYYTTFGDEVVEIPVDLVKDIDWQGRKVSQVDKPTKFTPCMREMSTYFEVLPDINQLILTYIRKPVAPNWTFGIVSGQPVFDPTDPAYVDFELTETEQSKLVFKICRYFGIEVKEADLYQAAEREQMNEQ